MKGSVVTEPFGSIGGAAAAKAIGGILAIGVVASALGFLVLLPRTVKEAACRALATMAGSALVGPFLVAAAFYKWPEVFASGAQLATHFGLEPWFGYFAIAAPLLAMAGLPFWWILGALVLWFEKRKAKDIGELAADAGADVRTAISPSGAAS